MNKRPFSSITKEECIACAKIIKPTVFTVTPKWEVVEADKSVYDKGGYSVKSKHNWFQFDIDFEFEDFSLWDTKFPESDSEQIDLKSHYVYARLKRHKCQ